MGSLRDCTWILALVGFRVVTTERRCRSSTRPSKPFFAARVACATRHATAETEWATAHPIRSARDLARVLSPQGLYSNR